MALLTLSPDQRSDLEYLASHAPLARQRCRALALLWLDEGDSVDRVAEALRVSRRTVYYWADRLRERPDPELSARLADAPRSGRPRTADGDIDSWIARVIDTDPHEFGY